MGTPTSPKWPAYAAAGWAFAFAALSVFWAIGGQLGLHPLETAVPTALSVLMNVFVALAKIVLGLLALASLSDRVSWGMLGIALWTAALALLAYGAVGLLANAAVVTGMVDLGRPPTRFHWYFVLLWDPFFVLGGVLFLLTALAYRRTR